MLFQLIIEFLVIHFMKSQNLRFFLFKDKYELLNFIFRLQIIIPL